MNLNIVPLFSFLRADGKSLGGESLSAFYLADSLKGNDQPVILVLTKVISDALSEPYDSKTPTASLNEAREVCG